jgi:predicted phage-related endonuclease
MSIERHFIESREQWLAVRSQDVTASVVGGLFGVHPYATALKLYLQHSGIEFDDRDNKVKRRGRIMESAVAAAVSEAHPEWRIEKSKYYYRDPDLRLGATPDFLILDDPRGLGVLQTKSVYSFVWERDWHGGTAVPFWIQLQALVEAMMTDAAFAVVAEVHSFDMDHTEHEIPRHPGAEKRITDAVAQFWLDVEQHDEPDADYGKDAELLRAIAPHEIKGKVLDLSGDNRWPAKLDLREQLVERRDGCIKQIEEIDTELKFDMRDAESVTGLPDWSVSWKTSHRPEYIVRAKDIRTLRIHHRNKDKPDAA